MEFIKLRIHGYLLRFKFISIKIQGVILRNKCREELPFCWTLGFPSLSSRIVLVGTHHILDRDISATLSALIDRAKTVVFEHPLIAGIGEVLPSVKEALDEDQIGVVRRILEELACPADIEELLIDEAVSLIQRAGYKALGDIFIPESWALNYSLKNGKEIAYVETPVERDQAASEMYIRYLGSLSTRENLLSGMKESIENYWRGIIEIEEGVDQQKFYRHGITRRSMMMMEHLVFEMMRRDNRAVAFFVALHCREIVEWLRGRKPMGEVECVLFNGIGPSGPRFREHCQAANLDFLSSFSPLTISHGVLERIRVTETRCPLVL
ncbi:MAG: hypothetical protein QGH39_12705 [Candidatus Thermoplasmatota archaeon]|nr:hypothetical protein [Candidatus Thermoplasmatota archaeon]MDP7266407.1 hypothetical protein [Candidatus Thermoplasmatota archaeon]